MCLIQLTLSAYMTFQIYSIYPGFKPFKNKHLSTWFETRRFRIGEGKKWIRQLFMV